jgi:hypothetical protein
MAFAMLLTPRWPSGHRKVIRARQHPALGLRQDHSRTPSESRTAGFRVGERLGHGTPFRTSPAGAWSPARGCWAWLRGVGGLRLTGATGGTGVQPCHRVSTACASRPRWNSREPMCVLRVIERLFPGVGRAHSSGLPQERFRLHRACEQVANPRPPRCASRFGCSLA